MENKLVFIRLPEPRMIRRDRMVTLELYAFAGPFTPDDARRIYEIGCDLIGLYRVVLGDGKLVEEEIHSITRANTAFDRAVKDMEAKLAKIAAAL